MFEITSAVTNYMYLAPLASSLAVGIIISNKKYISSRMFYVIYSAPGLLLALTYIINKNHENFSDFITNLISLHLIFPSFILFEAIFLCCISKLRFSDKLAISPWLFVNINIMALFYCLISYVHNNS